MLENYQVTDGLPGFAIMRLFSEKLLSEGQQSLEGKNTSHAIVMLVRLCLDDGDRNHRRG
jgi:hypothetical protein